MTELFDSCVLISRLEGREQKDAQGESLFERIKMQERDKALVLQYLFEAALEANKYVVPFGDADLSITGLSWTWKDSYLIPTAVEGLLERYLVNWAMAAWLRDKVVTRADYYADLCVKLLNGIVSIPSI